MKKRILNVAYGFCLVSIVWFLASVVDTNNHNMSDKDYSCWNAFNFFVREVEAKSIPQVNKAGSTHKISLTKKELKREGVKVPTKHYSKENLILLAKLIQAENGGAKHDETLYLTGAVVMKRVKAKCYPNTIREVIYQRGQYSTASRLDSVKPSTRSLEIANDILVCGVDELPDNLVLQAMFVQNKVYKKIDGEYFCLAG